MQFFTALLSVLALAVSTTATPLDVAERISGSLAVLSPPILQPLGNNALTYYSGSTQVCCWETDNIPAKYVNETGALILGHYEADGTSSKHLDYSELFE
jgi:hypothetical protein